MVALGGQLHRRVGIELGERGQLLQFALRPHPLHRHRQHRRQREKEMDLVLGELPPARRVRPENAKRLPVAGNRHGDPADHPVVRQQ